jgi:MSHA biogenesis protein MshO
MKATAPMPATARSDQRGFTLLEMVMTIVLLGIIGSVVAVFLRAPIQGYFDTANRASLTDAADGAMRRITRDVQNALPNSFRSTNPASAACVEFLPTIAAGRYRASVTTAGAGDILNFAAADTTFDVLAQVGMASVAAGSRVAIYNLGIAGADAYAGNTTGIISAASTSSITLNPARQFPFSSPGNRFFVIPSTSVVYSCSGTTLLRTTNAISAAPLAACPAVGTVLVNNVSACSFNYVPAVTTRNGALAISLELTQNNETVRLYQEVMVSNVP